MNYRRFFTVNSLICLSMENEAVFNDYNSFFGTLFKEGLVHGFRIDHIDGLYNPQQYVERLRGLVGSNCYLIAEKILEYHEEMPRSWGLEGTSGYEFLSYVNRVLTDMKGAERLKLFYQQFSGEKRDYQDIVFDKKRAFLYSQMRGELQNLMQLLQELQLVDASMDLHALKKALAIFMAAFPVYRIYPTSLPLSDESLVMVSKALETALRHEKELDKEFGFIKSLFEGSGNTPTDKKLSFIMRLMQFTGPLAAKGVEDTTFYVYNPLISHNEVGDAPDQLGISVEE
ncbi:MAG TPA: hypothetical protein VL947_13470, partial [Cytophagales bacterium]|nr:hypothetical protein [Cytophagales bacterium]